MSGIIGHTMYAILAGKAAAAKKLPIAQIIHRHYASYLCGSYLGCDIQTIPEARCIDTGQEVGYGTAPLKIERRRAFSHKDRGRARLRSRCSSAYDAVDGSRRRHRNVLNCGCFRCAANVRFWLIADTDGAIFYVRF